MLALTQGQGILLALAGGAIVAIVIVIVALRRPRTGGPAGADIPPAMAPGPSDPDLEKPRFQRLQGWGVLLLAFMAVWMPLYWFLEPNTNLRQEERLREGAVEHGAHEVELFSEENQAGVGCVRCHGPELKGQELLIGEQVANPPDLTTVCSRLTTEEITTTIEEGRGLMPSWSVKFKGALNDQQIQDLVLYLISIQDVPDDQNKCINPPESPAASPAATDTGSKESPAESPAGEAVA